MSHTIFSDEKAWSNAWAQRTKLDKKRCVRCLYDISVPGIQFNSQGICNQCDTHDALMALYQSQKGRDQFYATVTQIKKEGKNKPYDVVVGVSGGADSSYLLLLAKELGLRPLAVHFDNTWNSTIAVENIHNVLDKLQVELFTHVVDNDEYDDLYKAILKAGVPDLEAPTDLALAATLNMAAAKYKIKYIFEGHSFRTEGLSPLGWLYMDAKYIDNMHRQYGSLRHLKTYPYLWLVRQLRWMLINRFKKIRPLWYLDYDKELVKTQLSAQFGWRWYGGHHLENRMTHFYHSYFLPRRFGIDQRVNGYAALVRSNQLSREEGLALLAEPPNCPPDLIEMIKKRWALDDDAFIALMSAPQKTYRDFKTYKPTFEKMRPFFYLMAKMELIPMSFYLKYTARL